jgi:hypothetical protein
MVNKLKGMFGLDTEKDGRDYGPHNKDKFEKDFVNIFGFKIKKSEAPSDYYGENLYRQGTDGFKDFGSGTPAMLHGVEAVVPKNDIGQLANLLGEAGATTTNTPTGGDTITNNTTSTDMSILNRNTEQLVALTEKTANHLNTLVMIGAMTEKNTKSTNKSLADMGGSLV